MQPSDNNTSNNGKVRIGVISDTHGLLRESAIQALEGVDHILHIGDVCCPEILPRLEQVAPVHAVRGNCDYGEWANDLPHTVTLEVDSCWLYLIHDLTRIDLEPSGQFQVVLHGHTHMPEVRNTRGTLYFNPGSAGPPRAGKPISIGFLEIVDGVPSASWEHLPE